MSVEQSATVADDRRVHATLHGRLEIVRYDRSGKWYREHMRRKHGRLHIGIAEAVRIALQIESAGGQVFLGVPGGKAFDSYVNRRRGEKAALALGLLADSNCDWRP